MKYSKEKHLLIGREIYTHQISLNHAAEKYGINRYTAREYMCKYRDNNNLETIKAIYYKITIKRIDLCYP